MTQIFSPISNKLSILTILILSLTILLLAVSAYAYFQSSYYTAVGIIHEQPLPFSHKHHVRGLGLDCRFCHSAVEKSNTAGMPSTEVCMSCHGQIYKDALALAPLHQEKELQWTRVHLLPDHVYFDHSIHIKKGVSCSSCHGDVENMALVSKQAPMTMKWCLQCHQHQEETMKNKEGLTNCSTCHR